MLHILTFENINPSEAKSQIPGMRTGGFTLSLPFFIQHFVLVITDFSVMDTKDQLTYILEPNISRKILFGEYRQTLRRIRVIE